MMTPFHNSLFRTDRWKLPTPGPTPYQGGAYCMKHVIFLLIVSKISGNNKAIGSPQH